LMLGVLAELSRSLTSPWNSLADKDSRFLEGCHSRDSAILTHFWWVAVSSLSRGSRDDAAHARRQDRVE
jgi:hypothetical protein